MKRLIFENKATILNYFYILQGIIFFLLDRNIADVIRYFLNSVTKTANNLIIGVIIFKRKIPSLILKKLIQDFLNY